MVLSWMSLVFATMFLETVISRPVGLSWNSLLMTRTFSDASTHSALSCEP